MFGPVADNANGIGEMGYDKAEMGEAQYKKARQILADLDAVGNTTKAITKGIAIGSAVIAAVSLFSSFIVSVGTGMRVPARGLVIASTLELADLVATGARSEHSEGIIDLLAQSETAEIALLLKEKDDATRLSVRTKPGGVDATALCGTWGGGGHPRAAGASLPLPLAEAVAAVLPVAERYARAVSR